MGTSICWRLFCERIQDDLDEGTKIKKIFYFYRTSIQQYITQAQAQAQ